MAKQRESDIYRRNKDGSLTPISEHEREGQNGYGHESADGGEFEAAAVNESAHRETRTERESRESHLETKWDFLMAIAKQFGFNALLVLVMIVVCIFLYRENEKSRDVFLTALSANTTALGGVATQQAAMAEAQRQTNGRLDKLTNLMSAYLDHDDGVDEAVARHRPR